jgi:threonine synthase
VNFVSTRGAAAPVTLSEALSRGLADDGGLYVPETLPRFSPDEFAAPGGFELHEVATRLLAPFFAGDALEPELRAIVRAAFDIPCPLVPLSEPGGTSALLELFHGPSAAFKDFGARFLAQCMSRFGGSGFSREPPQTRTVLVATSGDTGGAVAAAFHRRPRVRVVVLYPKGLISTRQEQQLTSFGDNVSAFAVAGRFDDCQALVKRGLNDTALVARHGLTSANSISLGRLLPQLSYYAWASLEFRSRHGADPGFLIPTGNLGNALACVLVRAMGLPIGDIVFCLNANRVIADFLALGEYAPAASIATIANAMDVGAPSNLERLRWWYPDAAALARQVSAASFPDAAIRAAIVAARQRYGVVVCPHTATALAELMRRRDAGDHAAWVAVATAHPAKFETVVEPLLGLTVELPPALAGLLSRPSRRTELRCDYQAMIRALDSLSPEGRGQG